MEEERVILGELLVEVGTVAGHSCVSVALMPAEMSVSMRTFKSMVYIQEHT